MSGEQLETKVPRLPEHCNVSGCRTDGPHRRFVAKPIGTWSLAGAQPKIAAHEIALCDEHVEVFDAD